MSRTGVGLCLCVVLWFAPAAGAQEKLTKSYNFDPEKFQACIYQGQMWSECATSARDGNGSGATAYSNNPFGSLFDDGSTAGARVWTPSAVERFQGYLDRQTRSWRMPRG